MNVVSNERISYGSGLKSTSFIGVRCHINKSQMNVVSNERVSTKQV